METSNNELLPEVDIEFLDGKEYLYSIQAAGDGLYLILEGFSFPDAYTPEKADVLIIIPAGYPNAQLDMFWTSPDVKLKNGNWPETSDHHQEFVGKLWQRWSRHTTWRAGVDTLRTFISSMKKELAKGK